VSAYEAVPPRDVSGYSPQRAGARCDLCPLDGSQYVPASPPTKKLRLVIVGEGPGRKEVVQRRPFIGVTGGMLDEELKLVGIDRDEAWITNAALCLGETDEENTRAAECCAPRLLKELEALPPEAPILALGKAATRGVLGVKSILMARGFVWTARDLSGPIGAAEAALRKAQKHDKDIDNAKLRLDTLRERHKLAGRIVLPSLHPTFAFIHNETWSPIFHIDLDRAARWLRGDLTREKLADNIIRVYSLRELKKRTGVYIVLENKDEIAEAGKILKDEVSCDIETESIDPLSPLLVKILCVQISDGDRTFVIGPWDARLHSKVLTRVLKTKNKIVFHNGYCFDLPALERPGEDVVIDPSAIEDTLVAHHTFASQYPQRLDHCVSTFLDASPWKIKHGRRGAEEKGLPPQHMDVNELWHYGAIDAVLQMQLWNAMQADLASELAVYEHDKALGLQGKNLQVDGFRVDAERRTQLSGALERRASSLKGRMRVIARRPNFQPSKLGHVRRVLFGTLKAPMLNPTKTGLASTSNATLEVLRTGGAGSARSGPADTAQTSGPIQTETRETRVARFAEALLRWRVAVKIRSTYVNAVRIHDDGRAHYNWRPYGTNSGRYSCRLQSCPRWSTAIEDRPREMYTASPGCSLVYFDLSQAEARFAANLSGDPNFIKTCEGDVHTGNAKILFPDALEVLTRDPKGKNCPQHGEDAVKGARCNCGKPFRDIAKNAGFAVAYLAEAATVFAFLRAHGFPVELDAVEEMLNLLKASYKRYYEYVAENVFFVEKNGHLRTALVGRARHFGFHPKPQEIANFPIQSGIADCMNTRLLQLQKKLNKEAPRIRMVAQVHDAAMFDTPDEYVRWETDKKGKPVPKGYMVEQIEALWREPVRLEPSIVCRERREFVLPAEIKVGQRWSDFG